MFHNPYAKFNEHYRCYSIGMLPGPERMNVEYGGKVILPPSALQKLSNLNIEYPMLFRLNNSKQNTKTHAGVLEFIAEEGRVYLPKWMMNTLLVKEGDIIEITNVSLPLGKFVKIQPQHTIFLEITDPKAVLEQSFRNFSCLTQGDILTISYNQQYYDILVLETKPSEVGISIIETDLEVDFAAPLGYVEPDYKKLATNTHKPSSIHEHTISEEKLFAPFGGSGMKLGGKRTDTAEIQGKAVQNNMVPPALVLPPGKLYFGYPVIPVNADVEMEPESFSGPSQKLRKTKKK